MARQRIIIVDDHEVVRLGLRSLLDRHPDFEVVAEAGNGREAIEKVNAYQPDVVVLDIRLPGTSGVEVCQQITEKFPLVKVIMLTSYAEDEMLFAAIRAGAAGYVLKQIGGDDLVRAIEAVGRGEALLDPSLTQRVFEEVRKAQREEEASAFAELTNQEMQVLQLVSEGKTNREIADALYLGEGTVRLCEAGVVRGKSRGSLTKRLLEIHDGLAEVIAALKPEVMALEELYSHYARPQTAILMGHARGVICLAAAEAGLEVAHYSATRIKRILTGSGRAGKAQVQRAIQRELGLGAPPEPPDVADALAVALCHCYLGREK